MAAASSGAPPPPLGDREREIVEVPQAASQTFSLERGEASKPGWRGTSRYAVLRELGKGGMGVVYEALDRERGQSVALKTLLNFDATALYRFKQEFRTLSDVVHPNLVRLDEMVVSETDGAFFTMELVRGTDFRSHVGPAGRVAPEERSRFMTVAATPGAEPVPRAAEDPGPPERTRTLEGPCLAVFEKLRPALRQLAEGVQALHAAGHLHRDLKPSNVMVAADGRVVVLDLGVATSLRRTAGHAASEEAEMVGTATYMAPEQAFGATLEPAADWYSVGVILYEVLVGHPPFVGDVMDVITRKNLVDAVPPSQCVQGVPEDLDALCVDLLHRDPAHRPNGLDVLRRLGRVRSVRPHPSLAPVADPTQPSLLFGRDQQLGELREAFEGVVGGRPVAVRLGGESGMGKSALAAHFLDGLAERGDALVLRGRAYERESLPYKAVDSVIDEISRHLARCEDEGDPVPLPEGIGALARVFPVLRRVPSLADVVPDAATEPRELRSRAFQALRALFGALARRQPIVVYIDDAQWGDADSAALVLALLRPPEPPPWLLLMTYRSREATGSVFLTELRDGWPEGVEQRDVAIGPLSVDDAQALARTFLEGSDELAHRTARAVARESRGNPFLVQELARSNTGSGQRAEGDTLVTLTLEEMVFGRLERLPDGARRLIELIAVGGRPLPVSVIDAAAGLTDGVHETIALLGARRFARTGQRDGRDVVETTHDRIRETISAMLPAATLREHHAALARALEQAPASDAEAIALHWLGAGDAARAVRFAEDAADRSTEKLAFDHAARLFRLALEHTPASSERAQALRVRLATALQAGGRYGESSRAYMDAIAGAPPEQRSEFQRAAAEQLLAAGQIEEGTAMLYGVLEAVRMRAPRSQLMAVFWLIVYRIWLGFLGLRFRERSEVSAADRARIDALFTAAAGFPVVNTLLGACMTARHLVEALRFGDRFQVMRAASLEAGILAAGGGRETARERALVAMSRRLAEREGTPAADAYTYGPRGIGLFLRGRFREAREALDRALAVPLYGNAALSSVRLFAVYTMTFLGDLNEARRRMAKLVVEAEERGDMYTLVNLHTGPSQGMALAADDPERGRRLAGAALSKWPKHGFFVQHWQAVAYAADVDIYVGDARTGYERLKGAMPELEKSFLLHSAFVRIMTRYVLARAAIASIPACPDRRNALVAEARNLARQLEQESDAWPKSLAAQIRASVADAEGDRVGAIAELRLALAREEGADGMFALIAGQRLGLLLGGDEGRELVRRTVETMRAQGIQNPERWLSVYLPGQWMQPCAEA
jgi:serine/threonine protein kinase/tetratricopeptide (TPR) repeat protein